MKDMTFSDWKEHSEKIDKLLNNGCNNKIIDYKKYLFSIFCPCDVHRLFRVANKRHKICL